MDSQVLLLIIFVIFLVVLLFIKRKKLIISGLFPLFYFAMYRTRLGLKAMDRLAQKLPGFLKVLFIVGVILSFIGMFAITFELIRNSIMLLLKPATVPGVQLVLPFETKGGQYVPFMFWILSIFVIAAVHEFSHGVATRVSGLPVKSSGFAFVGLIAPVIPAAFVEPDEKKLMKAGLAKQLSVFAAGPFANIVFAALIAVLAIFVLDPFAESMLDTSGIKIASVVEDSPAARAGLEKDMIITSADNMAVQRVQDLSKTLKAKSAQDVLLLETSKGPRKVVLESAVGKSAYLGIQSRQHATVKESFNAKWAVPYILWLFGFLYWLLILNIGIGLFNLLPMGPLDGGRMLQVILKKIFNPKLGQGLWKAFSWALFLLVIVNVLFGFLG